MKKLIESTLEPSSNCKVVVVISNKADAKGLEVARAMGIEAVHIPSTRNREEGDSRISKALHLRDVQLICLAGYMRVLSASFVQEWQGRLINIHPSLLPSFKGLLEIGTPYTVIPREYFCRIPFARAAFESHGRKKFQQEQVDHGPIIAQDTVHIEDYDTEETLHKKIQQKEHKLFPEAMQRVASIILENSNYKENGLHAIVQKKIESA
ncbi:unnamed protein product [Nippostrongylus brasiliensis]|uniref:phosphoribosylglycinamide formyltransferase 1 n=1 Tax=Nippostrongylus brasiliensis TaxID=27835 RepID=A0A0N4YR83_NIPBR|nr:unnamed protein product [Nippostrongylus brasiliensis]